MRERPGYADATSGCNDWVREGTRVVSTSWERRRAASVRHGRTLASVSGRRSGVSTSSAAVAMVDLESNTGTATRLMSGRDDVPALVAKPWERTRRNLVASGPTRVKV